jgi:hypothetical protein
MPQRGARAARGPNSAAGSIRPNGGRLLSSPIMETNAGLPARRKRPRRRRIAEQRDELAPSYHSITSSASASSRSRGRYIFALIYNGFLFRRTVANAMNGRLNGDRHAGDVAAVLQGEGRNPRAT